MVSVKRYLQPNFYPKDQNNPTRNCVVFLFTPPHDAKPERFSFFNGITKKGFFEKKGIYYKFRAEIRKHAQYVYEKNKGDKTCKVCGYDKHIQICHIKSVSSFGDESLITDINSKDNLVGLCPNHHWEFDHGYLKL